MLLAGWELERTSFLDDGDGGKEISCGSLVTGVGGVGFMVKEDLDLVSL